MLKMYKFKFLIFIFVFFFYYLNLNASILIKYKIGNELITNFDIDNEKKYLVFLRPSLKNLSESEITKISENSLIREIIKKKEVDKIFKDIKSSRFIDELKKSLFRFKGVKNETEFLKILKKNDIDYKIILEKMKYEGLWNELVLQRYNSLVKIDKSKLKQKLLVKISNEKKYEYNLSELIFDVSNVGVCESSPDTLGHWEPNPDLFHPHPVPLLKPVSLSNHIIQTSFELASDASPSVVPA